MCRPLLPPIVLCLSVWAVVAPLGLAQKTKRPVADLIADLKKGEKEQLQAIQELEALGDKAAEAVGPLIDLLPVKNEDVRLQAALALGKIGPKAIGPLIKAVAHADADVRFYAVWALAFAGPAAKSAAPTLLKTLTQDESAQV